MRNLRKLLNCVSEKSWEDHRISLEDLFKSVLAIYYESLLVRIFKNANSERGFSLVELMVVLSILTLMSALALPKFLDYRYTHVYPVEAKLNLNVINSLVSAAVADNDGQAIQWENAQYSNSPFGGHWGNWHGGMGAVFAVPGSGGNCIRANPFGYSMATENCNNLAYNYGYVWSDSNPFQWAIGADMTQKYAEKHPKFRQCSGSFNAGSGHRAETWIASKCISPCNAMKGPVTSFDLGGGFSFCNWNENPECAIEPHMGRNPMDCYPDGILQ